MDIHRHLNEFMHLSLSKVSQWHSKHAFQLWSHHDRRHLARKELNSSLRNLQNACAEENKSLKIWKVHVQLCGIIEIIACAFFNRQILCSLQERPVYLAAVSWFKTSVLNWSDTYFRITRWRDSRGHVFLTRWARSDACPPLSASVIINLHTHFHKFWFTAPHQLALLKIKIRILKSHFSKMKSKWSKWSFYQWRFVIT